MEGLRFAINMEVEGEDYYRRQAEKTRGTALAIVFSRLAEDESRHAQILREYAEGKPIGALGTPLPNVFDGLEGFKPGSAADGQIEAYELALNMENKSVELYEKMLGEAGGESELFRFLIAQEKQHYSAIEEIIKMLRTARQWVESPEFGKREEY